MLKRLLPLVLLLAPVCAFGQGQAITGVTAQKGPGNLQRVIPFAPMVVCGYPATGGTPCTNVVSTYTSPTLGTACPAGKQIIAPATTTCMATSDSQGNFEVFVPGSSTYAYYFQANNTWFGPYVVTTSGSGGSGTITGVNPGTGLIGGGSVGNVTLALSTPVQVVNGGTGVTTSTGSGSVALNLAPTIQSPSFTGTPDASAATQIKLPLRAGFTAAANGELGYDTTNNNWHAWDNGIDTIMAPIAAGFVSGDCGQPTTSGGAWLVADSGHPCGAGTGGFPSGVGIAGSAVSGTGIISAQFLPPVDVQLFFPTPYPTYAQAQSQDFGAVLNAALLAATPSGRCVDVSALNALNAPNIAVFPVTTNIFAGLASNTYVPCIIGANFQIVTSVTQATAGGSLKIVGGAPGGIGGTGFVVQPCNTTGGCTVGATSVSQFPTSAGCASSGGIDCYATGLPSSGALAHYNTGTVTYTTGSKTVTGAGGAAWTTAMIGGTFVSACASNTCTIGSTSVYTTGRIVAVPNSTTLTLDATYAGTLNSGTSGQNYIIFLPNTSVVWCDACLGNNLQKSFTGHEIDNLAIDLNGISGAGFLAKGSQEGSVLNNFACFVQFTSPTGATAGGTCLAWDQSVRESGATNGSSANQTFLGHFSVHDGRMGVGTNTAGSSTFGAVVEGFSVMDGTVSASQANGASVWDFQAIIGGSGSARFQDALYLDGFSGMFIAGTHFEAVLNDDINIGPVNPVYNVGIYNITSSATLGNCAVEFGSGSSGNQIHGVSRPIGGCLAKDDNLSTTTVASSSSGTPASWTLAEYVQSANSGISIIAGGAIQADTAVYAGGASTSEDTACPTGSVSGVLCMAESSVAVTPTAGVDTFRADSVSHAFWASLNGGTEFLSGANLTATAHGIEVPLVCKDTSGSGTAQSCNTLPLFTPATGDCILYSTTTSNTGTGLTIVINGATAKSVAKWQSTTTLAANDIRANSPVLLCYDGTNIEITGSIGNAPSGGSGYTLQVGGSTLTAADTVNFNNTTPAASANAINVQWQTSKVSTTDSVSAQIVGDGTSTHFLNGVGTWSTPAAGTSINEWTSQPNVGANYGMGTTGQTNCAAMYLPNSGTFNNVGIDVTTLDNTNNYEFGIYTGNASSTITLQCHTTAAPLGASTGFKAYAFSAACSLSAGRIYMCFGQAAGTATGQIAEGWGNDMLLNETNSASTSFFPGTFTSPADSASASQLNHASGAFKGIIFDLLP